MLHLRHQKRYGNTFFKNSAFIAVCLLCFYIFLPVMLQAQEKSVTVKGTVRNETGEPLSGVSVVVKGTTIGSSTKADGVFQITAPVNSTLSITMVGYVNKEIKIGTTDQLALSVSLSSDKLEMDKVIVVGYGTRRKSDVTGSIVSISEQSIKDIPSSNLATAIQGQGAGIDIQRSGANSKPGATPNILIRGSRSLGASNDPLIVVDGIPFNGSINDLNQDDVASVEILKDGSSTAIYGSRGANGVILITTKRGKTAKAVFTYSGYAGTSKLTKEFPIMNAAEFTDLKKWANIIGNPGKYSGLDDPQFLTNGVFDPAEVEGLKTGRNTDWQSLIYKTGRITDHQLGVSGGSDQTQYAISGGYFNQTGIYYGQSFERATVKLSIDQQLGKIFKVGLNSLNTYSVRKGESANPMAQALRASPLASPYDSAGNILNTYVPGSANQVWNPLADLIPGAAVENRKRLGTFTTLYLEANLFKGLKYRLNAGAEIRSDVYGNFYSDKTSFRVNQGGSASSNRNEVSNNYTLENLLIYDATIAQKHKLNFTGLYSLQEVSSKSNQFDNTNILADYLAYFNPTYGSNLKGTGSSSKADILSYMGRVNYSFNDRYLLTLTVRADGSSRLAEGNKWHSFPSAAFAWNVSRENFMQNIPAISNLKLRASYGSVGQQSIKAYQTLGQLSGLVYNYGSNMVTGAYLTSTINGTLSWEYTKTANLGIDFGVLGNRITGSVEVYKAYTNKLLLPQTLTPTSGIPNPIVTNVGKTENKGIEVHISTTNIQAQTRNNFSWTSDFNFFMNRGKITQLAGGTTKDVANGWFVGQPLDVYYDYKRQGIWQNTAEDTAAAKALGLSVSGTSSVIGTIRVADVSGPDGKPDSKIDATYDRIIVGTSQPKWEGGTTQRFGYRGFDLTVVAFARWGYTMNSSLYGGGFVNTYQGTYNNIKTHYWTPDNHEPWNPKPNSAATNPLNRSVMSYFDGSFLKIRSISLGYNLDQSLVKRIGAKNFRVYATAADPFILFSPYRRAGGIDPEGSGTVGVDTPPTWSLIFGINMSF
ncbi:SusC/RagA family TonB-linked outer membrane protein [Niastella koreensis]|uniref:TonB-dependent receptor plug n=2 Tax=Niastella koreensis TaxID=354356 RepID=G8TG26_NIAKG|nr:TonB-dependent receptor [Niastella koreensis]AEW01629.1 TonB-dependent receptor plug [Niastella koreensis GR20-10]OQP48343.1 SusC/RagA family TonB-linked outer membrane protein [Niastella koreensis]